ncbi:YezD family protein [Radiobacillus kanasensis]|uniref:YezD family protein n=1 Tax=Radiobacillus kanasensis TaxID=2844358 RepID=UPI001E4B98BB|nr:YezD family protein [Radiobacillus kanasensis]UFT98932.1 YezD family protein [Radiobacillus kanasensis]
MAKKDEAKLNHILATLRDLEYGSVVITVHDGEITQIDTTEKKRFSLQKNKAYEKK